MSMLHDDDESLMENAKAKGGFILGCILAVSGVILVLLLTFAVNKKPEHTVKNDAGKMITADKENADLSSIESNDKKTSNELSFWHMYDEDETNNSYVPTVNGTEGDDKVKERFVPENTASEDSVSDNKLDAQKKAREKAVSENMFDVNELSDGEAEFALIMNGIPMNGRYEEGFTNEGIWKDYALNGRKTSYRGIDVSSYQKNIDWEKVALSGVDFAMIRVGSRGYGSGRIVLDEKCADNMRGCSENAIKIGLYFQSQATNIVEAVEEANYCVGSINGHNIEYPIVFVSEAVVNDSYRTEQLTKEELSEIAKAFCDTVRAYGYKPMIGASKKQFAMHMDLRTVSNYDLWLFDTDEQSVFPYRYNMWQYSITGNVDGIEDPVDLNISFTDYSVK